MVRVAAAQQVEVDVEPSVVRDRPEEVVEELGGHGAHALGAERHRELDPGAAGQVEGNSAQEFDVGAQLRTRYVIALDFAENEFIDVVVDDDRAW